MNLSLHPPSRRAALAVVLGCLLSLVYFLTFSGIPKANDELWLADTTQSVAVHGKYTVNQTQFTQKTRIISDVEPLQPILAAPLYWIGYHLPWAGNIHALYLFNPLVTALTAILLFYYALMLGYRERTALIAALLFGLTSMAWPYTRTFFREPLAGLSLLAAAYLWEQWRVAFVMQSTRRWWWFAAAAGMTCLALLGKEAALFALPMLALIAWPGTRWLRRPGRDRNLLITLSSGLVIAVLALIIVSLSTSGGRIRPDSVPRLVSGMLEGLAWSPEGMAGLLVSPGRGLWWFSPVLLLALASPALLPKARWRESWLILGMTLVFAVAYSAIRRDLWFGGAGWGARFMLPLIPLLMLATLPGIERMLNSARRLPKIALGALAALGLGVQVVGSYVDIFDYSDYLQQTTGQLPWQGAGIWSVRWSQIIGGLLYLPRTHTDLMWFYKGVDWLALAAISAGAVAAGAALWRLWRGDDPPGRLDRAAVIACPALVVLLGGFVLWRSMPDMRYMENTPQIEALRADLEQTAGPRDIIMLSNWHYASYFMNSYKGRAEWWGLGNSPGERFSPEQPADVESDQLIEVIGRRNAAVMRYSLQHGANFRGGPVWLVGDASAFLAWATRPPEWYLAQTTYFVSAQDYASNVRLSEFLPLIAPDTTDGPAILSGATFGGSIRLVGADLNFYPERSGEGSLRASDMLGLSLLWESLEPVSTDYTVAVHLISPGQTVAAQQDRQPVEGFAPTSKWKAGDKIRDNFGFILPADLPPGQYQLWVTIYSWPSLDKLPVTGLDGRAAGDHLIVATVEVVK